MNHFYVQTFAYKSFDGIQYLIHHSTRHLIDKCRRAIMLQCIRPAMNRMSIHTLISDIYSPTSLPFLIRLIHHDLHDLLEAIFNMLTMCIMSVQSDMQLDTSLNTA